ncbi:MAG: molybdenum cofactor guanylyltransferase [Candidatus Dormibacteraeota bacterium]|nr:molybdenum cofactor guanylyltransferase [Candidatus Dormibacteraeota bacterium]
MAEPEPGRHAAATLLLLAGGGSRRMGRPKALLPWQDSTLLEWLARRLAPGFTRLLISAAHPSQVPASLRAQTVIDPRPGEGPLAGLVAGLQAAPDQPLLAVACDMPNVTLALLSRLLHASRGWDAAMPRLAGQPQATCAAYQPAALGPLAAALQQRRLKLSDAVAGLCVNWLDDEEASLFENLNTPADYRRLFDAMHDGR